jgi:glucans biosynthesis protein C
MTAVLPAEGVASRLFFVDHLRVWLIVLVVLTHVSEVYGAGAILQVAFILVNQGYFMGLFFLISGYFTPASFERRGPKQYVKDRLLRLGIPFVVGTMVVNPIAWIGNHLMPADPTKVPTPLTWQQYPVIIVGQLWFLEMLLIFELGYLAWRLATASRVQRPTTGAWLPGYRSLGVFALALALVTYLFRIAVPIGVTTPVLGFPTPSYIPQYLSFFVLGTIAYRNNWLRAIPGSMGKVGLGVSLAVTLVLFPLAVLLGKAGFIGGGTWSSAVYALWDSVLAVGMAVGMVALFRRYFSGQGRFGRFLSRHAYTVYVIHVPVVIWVGIALRGIQLEQLVKFVPVALLVVPLNFGVAYLVRKIPLASRVL